MIRVTMLRIKQTKSGIGRLSRHKKVLRALGLRGPGAVVEHADTEAIRGMIKKVEHLISVEVIEKESK